MANTFKGTDPRTSSLNSILNTARRSSRAKIKNLSLKQQIANMEKDRDRAAIAKANAPEPVEVVRFAKSSQEYIDARK